MKCTRKMEIKTLEKISISKLKTVFNQSFSDYFINMVVTKESLSEKILAENIKLDYSVGAFENNELVGFILIAIDVNNGILNSYNAGTGVIPIHRGKHLTSKMYVKVNEILKKLDCLHHQLEVISLNKFAINTYEKIGLKKERILNCYKVRPKHLKKVSFDIKTIKFKETEKFIPFWNIHPSWQNKTTTIQRALQSHIIYGAFKNNILIGYAIVQQQTSRLKQIFVLENYRNLGIGSGLVSEILKINHNQEITITGVDTINEAVNTFFNYNNELDKFLVQYEMTLKI